MDNPVYRTSLFYPTQPVLPRVKAWGWSIDAGRGGSAAHTPTMGRQPRPASAQPRLSPLH